MTEQQTKEALFLLKEAQSLGLTFDIGRAYISRQYIEEQEILRARIATLFNALDSFCL